MQVPAYMATKTRITKTRKRQLRSLCFVVSVFVVSWLLVAGVGLSAQTPAPTSPNWPQFRGNPRLTGVAAIEPRETLKLRWTYEAGESIESSAAIVDGAVYVG